MPPRYVAAPPSTPARAPWDRKLGLLDAERNRAPMEQLQRRGGRASCVNQRGRQSTGRFGGGVGRGTRWADHLVGAWVCAPRRGVSLLRKYRRADKHMRSAAGAAPGRLAAGRGYSRPDHTQTMFACAGGGAAALGCLQPPCSGPGKSSRRPMSAACLGGLRLPLPPATGKCLCSFPPF